MKKSSRLRFPTRRSFRLGGCLSRCNTSKVLNPVPLTKQRKKSSAQSPNGDNFDPGRTSPDPLHSEDNRSSTSLSSLFATDGAPSQELSLNYLITGGIVGDALSKIQTDQQLANLSLGDPVYPLLEEPIPEQSEADPILHESTPRSIKDPNESPSRGLVLETVPVHTVETALALKSVSTEPPSDFSLVSVSPPPAANQIVVQSPILRDPSSATSTGQTQRQGIVTERNNSLQFPFSLTKGKRFSTISIFLSNQSKIFHQELYNVLQQNPAIFCAIRNLQFVEISSEEYKAYYANQGTGTELSAVEFERFLIQRLIDISQGISGYGLHTLDLGNVVWKHLHVQTRELLISLMKSSQLLRTVHIPVCCGCATLRSLIDAFTEDTLLRKELVLVNSHWSEPHDDPPRVHLTRSATYPGSSPRLPRKRAYIARLELRDLTDENLRESAFFSGCLLDFSYLRKLSIIGGPEIFRGRAIEELSVLASNNLESLTWRLTPTITSELPQLSSDLGIKSNPVHLRRLTLAFHTPHNKSELIGAFQILKTKINLDTECLKELDLVYSSSAVSQPSKDDDNLIGIPSLSKYTTAPTDSKSEPRPSPSAFEVTLRSTFGRANDEFKVLFAENNFPSLINVRLFIIISDRDRVALSNQSGVWVSSAPNASGAQPLPWLPPIPTGWNSVCDWAFAKENLESMQELGMCSVYVTFGSEDEVNDFFS